MAGILTVSPLVNPAEYNRVVLAGIDSSSMGVVELTGANRVFNWDVKKSAGSQGQTITYRGWDLAKPKLKFKFWETAQIEQFYSQMAPALYYDAEKTAPKPVDIYHPKTFANEIFWVVTEDIGDLVDEGAQLWTITIALLEYRQAKAKNATTTPNSVNTAQNGGATKPSVLDDQDREIERLREELRRPF